MGPSPSLFVADDDVHRAVLKNQEPRLFNFALQVLAIGSIVAKVKSTLSVLFGDASSSFEMLVSM